MNIKKIRKDARELMVKEAAELQKTKKAGGDDRISSALDARTDRLLGPAQDRFIRNLERGYHPAPQTVGGESLKDRVGTAYRTLGTATNTGIGMGHRDEDIQRHLSTLMNYPGNRNTQARRFFGGYSGDLKDWQRQMENLQSSFPGLRRYDRLRRPKRPDQVGEGLLPEEALERLREEGYDTEGIEQLIERGIIHAQDQGPRAEYRA